MVITQALLATPIITARTHRAIEKPWQEYGAALCVDGAARSRYPNASGDRAPLCPDSRVGRLVRTGRVRALV